MSEFMEFDQLDPITQNLMGYLKIMQSNPEMIDFVAVDPYVKREAYIVPKPNPAYGYLRVVSDKVHPQAWSAIIKLARMGNIDLVKINYVEVVDNILSLSAIHRINPSPKTMETIKLRMGQRLVPQAVFQAVKGSRTCKFTQRQNLLTLEFAVLPPKRYKELLEIEKLYKESIK